jgi:hypothetical protein
MALSSPTQVYYNLDVANEQIGDGGVPPAKLQFTEVRSSNLLDNPNDYFMSIVRFSLDTAGSLPIFLPSIDTQQPNDANFPNKTNYLITLAYQDPAFNGGIPIITNAVVYYIPHRTNTGVLQNQQLRPPRFSGNMTLEDATSEYYWVQSWGQWISMLNVALAECYANLKIAFVAAGGVATADFDENNPPFFRWDDATCKASFIAPYSLFNQGGIVPAPAPFIPSGPPYNFPDAYSANTPAYNAQAPQVINNAKINLFFNAPLHILFSSFEWVFNSYGSPFGESFMMRVYSKMGDNWVVADTSGRPAPKQKWDALVMEQEYSTGPTMCPIARIVFLASLIPVLPSNIGVPRIFSGTVSTQAQQNNNISNEITDLVVNLVRGDEYLPNIIYEPTAEYRLLDLQGNTPAGAIQIKVQWVDVYGYYHDFYLQNGCGAHLKIMFRKKAFNNISS